MYHEKKCRVKKRKRAPEKATGSKRITIEDETDIPSHLAPITLPPTLSQNVENDSESQSAEEGKYQDADHNWGEQLGFSEAQQKESGIP